MAGLDLQEVPPQPVPGDAPEPPRGPGGPPQPITDPTREPPPIRDPDVVDPATAPDQPMIA